MTTEALGKGHDVRFTPGEARARLLADIPVTEQRLQLAGVSTAVLEGGSGSPIVLLHGPGESSIWWMRVIPGLVTTHRAIVPDLPGHGDSEAVGRLLDSQRVFDWLDELIERTCSSPPVLVGHLLGGAVAARFAIDRRSRVRQLVLVDSFGLGKFRPAPRFAFGLIRFLMRPNEGTYASFLPQCIFDTDSLHRQMGVQWEPFLAYNLDRARDPGWKAALRIFMRKLGTPKIPAEELDKIDVPTSLIWGRHDKAVKLQIAEAASQRYGWPLHVIENARDDPKLEQPEAFLSALHAALESATVPA